MARIPRYRGLEAFRHTMLSGSVSDAAMRMNVSQPAVSRLIKDVEIDLGLTLFDRVRGRLQPTQEAHLLLDEIQRSFIGLERIAAAAAEIGRGRRPTLTIGSMPTIASTILPGAISEFTKLYPETIVRLQSLSSTTGMQMVLTRECDLGFVSSIVSTPALHFERQYRVACQCILPASHPLASRDVLTPEDLYGEPMVCLPQSTLVGMQIRTIFDQHRLDRFIQIETPHSPLVSELVLAGVGFGIVDDISALEHVRRGGCARPFLPEIKLELGIVRARDTPKSNIHTTFVEICDIHLCACAELIA